MLYTSTAPVLPANAPCVASGRPLPVPAADSTRDPVPVDAIDHSTPAGCPAFSEPPDPIANADSSSRSFASASSPGSWSAKFVSSITSNEPRIHAAAFFGKI